MLSVHYHYVQISLKKQSSEYMSKFPFVCIVVYINVIGHIIFTQRRKHNVRKNTD